MERPMNTAARDRIVHKAVEQYIRGTEKRRTPVSRVKLSRPKVGAVEVIVHSSRPQALRMEASDMAVALKEEFGGSREVVVSVVAEARAVAKFVRCGPMKARLVINVLKGKRVSEALALLQFIPKHAAEPITKVLKSAAANAQDGWGALAEELKIANFIADGGPSLKRVRPRAQGRAYRILKRTSHLTVVLTELPRAVPKKRVQGKAKVKKAAKPIAAPTKATAPEAVTEQIEEPNLIGQTTAPVVEPETVEQIAEVVSPDAVAEAPVAETDEPKTE